MSGFTHRLTNQIRGQYIRDDPRSVGQFLAHGWLDDPVWLLRELHELAHVDLNFTPVSFALALVELHLDCAFFECIDRQLDPAPVVTAGATLNVIRAMLAPWSEAVALSTEWDLDLSADEVPDAHHWLAELTGPVEYHDRLWRARLSDTGVSKKLSVLLSPSRAHGGHLLGHLLSRALSAESSPCDGRTLTRIRTRVFTDPYLAHAILDMADASPFAADEQRQAILATFADAVGSVLDRSDEEPPPARTARRIALQRLIPRIETLRRQMDEPPPRRDVFEVRLVDVARVYSYASRALSAVVGLGAAKVNLRPRGRVVDLEAGGTKVGSIPAWSDASAGPATIERSFCVECGPHSTGQRIFSDGRLLHAETDDPHLQHAFQAVRFESAYVERAQASAAMLSAAHETLSDSRTNAQSSRLAASFAAEVLGRVTGSALNLSALDHLGVSAALGRDRGQLKALAWLSNAWPAASTDRSAFSDAPAWTDEQLIRLDAHLQRRTGLPLFTPSGGSVLW